jgi:hypothetical protein
LEGFAVGMNGLMLLLLFLILIVVDTLFSMDMFIEFVCGGEGLSADDDDQGRQEKEAKQMAMQVENEGRDELHDGFLGEV